MPGTAEVQDRWNGGALFAEGPLAETLGCEIGAGRALLRLRLGTRSVRCLRLFPNSFNRSKPIRASASFRTRFSPFDHLMRVCFPRRR